MAWTVASGAYTANAVKFDGTNDWLTRGAGLTGAADSPDLLVSFWVNPAAFSSNRILLISQPGNVQILTTSGGALRVILVGGGSSFQFNSSTNLSTDSWTHVVATADTNQSAGNKTAQIYFSDVDAGTTVTSDDDAAFSVDFTATDWRIGANFADILRYSGCLSEVWFGPGQALDLSIEANRRKFIDADGKPVDLGADGSTPTGTAPLIYLNGDATSFQTNAGTGGDFTVTGALEDCATSPSGEAPVVWTPAGDAGGAWSDASAATGTWTPV